MSAGHLSRQFRRTFGESPYSYLMTRRIERAMALLRRGDLSVTEVCFAVGCSSLGTFSTRFTELVGMPPSTYRRRAARNTAGLPPCVAKQVTRPVRNQEAPVAEPLRPGVAHPEAGFEVDLARVVPTLQQELDRCLRALLVGDVPRTESDLPHAATVRDGRTVRPMGSVPLAAWISQRVSTCSSSISTCV